MAWKLRPPTAEELNAYGRLRWNYKQARGRFCGFTVDDISAVEGSPYQAAWQAYEQATIELRRYMENTLDVAWPDPAPE